METPEPPIPLPKAGLAFWNRHFARLTEAGILTDADFESFAVLCLTWGKLQQIAATEPGAGNYREMAQFNALLKQYHAYAKQFGLLPRERSGSKLGTPPAEKTDEFGL